MTVTAINYTTGKECDSNYDKQRIRSITCNTLVLSQKPNTYWDLRANSQLDFWITELGGLLPKSSYSTYRRIASGFISGR